MSASVPWSVNAVDPEAWANARDAARRSGQSVGEWLEAAIREAAHERGRQPRSSDRATDPVEQRLDDLAERLDHFARQVHGAAHTPARQERGDSALLDSIEALNARIDTLARNLRSEEHHGPAEVRAAIQRLDDRIEDLVARGRLASASVAPELERKLETISHTIEMMGRRLEQENARLSAAPSLSPADELDDAVAEIMMRQSALDGSPTPQPRPRREQAPSQVVVPPPDLSGLESQLKIMADEMQAMRRAGLQGETVDTLRRDIGELADKLGELAPRRSLEALERAVDSIAVRLDRAGNGRKDDRLSEVAQALHDIRSALAEVRPAESFTSVEKDLHELSGKLDNLSVRGVDGNTVARLQEQTAEIRELLSSALPNDVLKALVEQIEMLVRKFESGSSSSDSAILDVLTGFDRRIEALSERIEAATRQMPAAPTLEDIRKRLDELQNAVAGAGQGSSAGVEATLRALSQKIDATEARLGNLGSIERGLADLFAQLEDAKTSAREATERAARSSIREMAVAAPAQGEIEQPRRAASNPETIYSSVARAMPVAPDEGEAAAIPADFPLEPGSGAPRMRLQSAALRVAQSEAALGGIGTSAPESPGRTSDFIAAARRAAQAAAEEPAAKPAKTGPVSIRQGIGALFGRSRRALLIALTAFLVIFAALRFFDGQLLNPFRSGPEAPASKAAKPAEGPVPMSSPPAPPAPRQQDRSSQAAPASDAFAAAPSAGVIGSGDLAFMSQQAAAPVTTGSTAAKPPAPVQAALAPAGAEAAPESDGGLPAALGTSALRAAAIAGDPIAAYEIGVRYLEGRGVRADATEAAIWLERAIAKGSAPAAYRLGNIHEKGAGSRKNPALAMRYYMTAAEGGNIKAMHNLAVMHAEGPDGKPDYGSAARWFRLAADRGVRDSQYNLGVLYARGLGVEQNLAESFRWFALAANQGDADAAKKRDDVAKRLDVQSLVAAKLAVQTWAATPVDASANEAQLRPEWDKVEAPARKRSVKK